MFLPVAHDLFFTKNDPHDLRLGDLFKPLLAQNLNPDDIVICGYPDDEGIKMNGGRVGAASAPRMIRQFLYKMTPPFDPAKIQKGFYDFGDLDVSPALTTRHMVARQAVHRLFLHKAKVISFGGGHDYGYSDGAAFIETYAAIGRKPLIINFDAHLDVRPPTNGYNSGTPFYRLVEEFGAQFQLLEIGMQPQCNSPHHWRWALNHDVELISLEQVEQDGWSALWKNKLLQNLTPEHPVYVSFDIDALTASEAGGCSQAWPTGLKMADCLNFIAQLYKKSDVRGLGIYEVSPPLDRDFQTSKAAALLAHQFIFKS